MMGGAIYLHTVYEDGSKLYFVLALEFTHKSEIFLCLHRLFGVSVGVFSGLFGDRLCSKGILNGRTMDWVYLRRLWNVSLRCTAFKS